MAIALLQEMFDQADIEGVVSCRASLTPDDWVEVTDEASGRIFYGNVKTGATQFERPQ